MIHQIGGLILLALAVAVFGRLLGGEAARTWDARWPQTRPSRRQAVQWATGRARSAGRSAFSYGHARLARSRAAGWMPARVRRIVLRPPGAAPASGDSTGAGEAPHGTPGATPPAGPAEPPRPGPAPRGEPTGQQAATDDAQAPPARKVVQGTVITDDDEPDASPATPAAPQSATGRNPEMTTSAASPAAVPGAEEMTAGMARLRAYAVSGNILHKQAALAALAEVLAQNAAVVAALAQSMQEESMYGPEITEPVAQMAPALQALSTRAAEAESQVASLARTPVGEVPGSRHQAPARAEMAEAGGR